MTTQVLANADKDRDGWLAARRELVTASELPIIMGLVDWETPLGLWQRKLGLKPEPDEREAWDWASEMEEPIARWFASKTGRVVTRSQDLVRNEQWPWLAATLDYETWAPEDQATLDLGPYLGPLDVKTRRAKGEVWDDGVPDYYAPQYEAQGRITGAGGATAAVSIWGAPPIWTDYDCDDALWAQVLEASYAFYKALTDETPPPVSAGDRDNLKAMYPKEEPGTAIVLPADAAEIHAELVTLKAERKQADGRIRLLENRIIEMIGDKEAGLLPGGLGSYSYRTQSRKGYEVKPTSFRKLSYKKS